MATSRLIPQGQQGRLPYITAQLNDLEQKGMMSKLSKTSLWLLALVLAVPLAAATLFTAKPVEAG